MSDYPLVNIIITTYDPGDNSRFPLLLSTIKNLKEKLHYPNSGLKWIIVDDGSSTFPHSGVSDILSSDWVFMDAARGGVGKSKNIALQRAFASSPYVLLLEDDWVLQAPLNLLPHIEVLRDNEDVGMVRFGYLGGPMEAEYKGYGDAKSYWKLKHKSGHYVYSGQVSLRHQRFYTQLGYHQENVEAGMEEDEFCHRYNNTTSVPDILWPAQYGTVMNSGIFINIGLDNSVNAVRPG